MSVLITGSYQGNKKCTVIHEPSGTQLSTAAPKDNQGDGSSFSPTDLVAVALGSCMTTTMAIVAERSGLDLTGTNFRVEKHMIDNPRRIGKLVTTIEMPAHLSPDERKKMENSAKTCPVHRSLSGDVEVIIEFVYR